MHINGEDGHRRLPVAAWVAIGLGGLFLPPAWGGVAPCPPASSTSCATPLAKPAVKPAIKAAAKVRVSASPAVVVEGPPPGSFRATLDPLPGGGWVFISDGPPENPSAVYASTHGVQHIGNVVTAWIRWEFARPQAEVYPLHYLSAVTREELDCDARAYRRAGVFYYARNDLQEKEVSFTALDDDTTWKSAIPGSEGDAMLTWGCPAAAAHSGAAADGLEQSARTEKSARSARHAAASSAPEAAPSSAPAAGLDMHTVR